MSAPPVEDRDTAERTVPAADPERVRDLITEFAAISEDSGGPGVTRLAYTPLERAAHGVYAERMKALGLKVWTDAGGNTIAESPGTDPRLPVLGTGSHLDSVPRAGAYDGIAGVVAAMETARLYKEGGTAHRHPVRFVAFAAEEGARFGQACTGSRIAAGLTTPGDLHARTDADGVSIAEAMALVGLDADRIGEARWAPSDWAAFVELHIEQGALLDSLDVPIGVVDLISGSTRLLIEITGRASHTGGTPMHLRADALAASAEIVLAAESLANDIRHRGTRITVGRLDVGPGSITTIPGHCRLYVDVRDVDSDRQRDTANELVDRVHTLTARRGTQASVRLLADTSPVVLPVDVRDRITASCRNLGLDYRVMPSGASHDSQMVNHVVPTGMVFVPSLNHGVSHAPDEHTRVEDLARGIDVLASSLLAIDTTADQASEEPR